MAYQCVQGNYHINTDLVHMEFMDAKRKESLSGDGGNIIVTRLFGKGTPIVRYTGINDFVIPSEDSCDCDNNTPLISQIGGRQVDSIILPNGDILPPSSLTGIPHKVMKAYHSEKIEQFQIVQQSETKIDILLVLDQSREHDEPSNDTLCREIQNQFEHKLGQEVTIRVKLVKTISLNRPHSATLPPVVFSKVKPVSYTHLRAHET